ncbi:MAG: glycerophosphodiester phosphodiesterase [Alphaproteobacteria bacterium]
MRKNEKVSIIGHRGFSSRHAGNSMWAFRAALEAGVDAVETDLRESCDGVLLCAHYPFHVSSVPRNPFTNPFVSGSTSQTLEKLGYVPFSDLLDFVRGQDIRILCDLKVREPQFPRRVLDQVGKSNVDTAQIILGVRNMAQMEHRGPAKTLGFLPYKDMREFFNRQGDIFRVWEKNVPRLNVDGEKGVLPQGRIWVMTKMLGITGKSTQERLSVIYKNPRVTGILLNDVGLIVDNKPALDSARAEILANTF